MIIVGAKGFAKEVLEILQKNQSFDNLAFYDDMSLEMPDLLYDKFPVLKTESEVVEYFKLEGPEFSLGLGKPILRQKMYDKFRILGGKLTSTISDKADIGSFDIKIGQGTNVLPYAVIANGSNIGKGCIVYYNTLITHDCIVGDFVELSPGVTLLGSCKIGSHSQIGANATILPGITVGQNAIIGAGAVVTKDVQDNCTVVGIPAQVIKTN